MLTEGFAGALYGPGQALDATKYFIIIPDAIGTGGEQQAVRRPAGGVPGIQLRRHGGRPVRSGEKPSRHRPSAPRHGQLDGRDADLGLGRHSPRLHGCARADGVAARPDVRPQLDDAPDADRRRPHGSGLGRRQLQGAAAQSGDRQRLVLPSPPATARSGWRRSAIRARRRTPTSTSGSPRPRRRTPTTRCTSGARRATSIRPPTSARSRRRCW